MQTDLRKLYEPGVSAEELAKKVIEAVFKDTDISLPVDPFHIMRDNGVIYQLMDMKKLEGVYLVPEDEDDIAVVGINANRPITRQRFTAAHELCHHIKDHSSEACEIGARSNVEKYAENFAAALLMPQRQLSETVDTILSDTHPELTMDDILDISVRFGVSFTSCGYRLLFVLHAPIKGADPKKQIKNFRPDKRKTDRGIDIEDLNLLAQLIDSYTFFYNVDETLFWLVFKNDFIFSENRMEGIELDRETVSEIITDIRLHGTDSEFCGVENAEIIQIMGHASMYDYVSSTSEKPSVEGLMKLNRMLFQYAPYPEYAGKMRDTNTLVIGAKFETIDYRGILPALDRLSEDFDETMRTADNMSITEYIGFAARIHHSVTQIHPFRDGNGRTSRALLNWMFKMKSIPPIYIRLEDKEYYYDALRIADEENDFKELIRVLIHELIKTCIRINKKVSETEE